jgi:hypothetical protein
MTSSHVSNTFRLFISSTFSDFTAEREALQKRVFPELEKFCAERGARFQAIDLRWGITEEAQQEHDTLRICLEEVRRCQALSPRPNFAVLLGDRYGWEPVPARIPMDHWEGLLGAASGVDNITIRGGYQGPDLNAAPPVMHLRKREADWATSEARQATLRHALRRAANQAGFMGDDRLPYFASATHQEIALGALDTQDEGGNALHPEEHVNVYARSIEGLPNDASARAFIDWDETGQGPVLGARQRLAELEAQLRVRLPGKVHDIQACWGIDGTDESHLDAFCAQFLADQQAIIERELSSRHKLPDSEARNAQHQSFAKERARNFVGRKPVLRRIGAYLGRRRKTPPLIVHGGGGSGKSALIAQAYLSSIEGALDDTVRLARFIGGVPGTESLMTLLIELTADIAAAYGQPTPPIPESMRAARQAFEEALRGSTAERPLVLFLDALDQLDRTDGALLLEWLPKELSDHTRIVASTREGQTLHSAQRRYPKSLLEVPSMTPAEGRWMLDAWLADTREAHYNAGIAPTRGRRLTQSQREQALGTFERNGKPLWLKLAYEEARNWASWDETKVLPATVEAMVEDLITRRLLEVENHPHVFATRALTYLTAGRFGLSEEELDQALATDPEVTAEFEAQNAKTGQKWEPDEKRPRLPPILWSRLYFDLQPYLAAAQVDGTIVYRWFHREFKEEIGKRYLTEEKATQTTHGHLADTFFALAPHGDDLFRYADASGKQQPAALRRVMEQPWQLARAGRIADCDALLTDFGFCMGKCAANRSEDLVADTAPLQGDGRPHGYWVRHLIAWKNRLRNGVASWPSHRILAQLTAESIGFKDSVRRPAYFDLMSTIPVANVHMGVEVLHLRRLTQLQGLPLTEATRFVLFDRRWLLVIDATAVGAMVDADTDQAVGVPMRIDGASSTLQIARAFGVQASTVQFITRMSGKDGKEAFDWETRYSGVLRVHGSELVLGEGGVEYLGATVDEWMFVCDGEIILVNAAGLLEPGVAPGCFSLEGARIDLYENMRWNYSRFGICVFLSDSTLLSLGWESSHSQRDEIKAEIWDLRKEEISRRSEMTIMDGLDLPLAFLGVLEDGCVVFTGENFLRSYRINPNSSADFEHLWPMSWSWFDPERPDSSGSCRTCLASDWRWPEMIAKGLGRTHRSQFGGFNVSASQVWVRMGSDYSFGNHERIRYSEHPLVTCAEWLDEGTLVLWGDMEELEDFVAPSVLVIKDGNGRELRWHSDVPIRKAVRVSATEIVVIKKTGPVRIDLCAERGQWVLSAPRKLGGP